MFSILILLVALLAYYKFIRPYSYWKKLGVPSLRPWPVLGNVGPSFLRQKSYAENINDMYKKALNKRYLGFYEFFKPTLMIKDVDLLKKIIVKDFDVFTDHSPLLNQDPVASKGLFFLKYSSGWHDMRSVLSPVFTGSKMRIIFGLMEKCSENLMDHFLQMKDKTIRIELSETVNKITNDIIASTAFGVDCDSLKNPENEFYLKGKRISNIQGFPTLFLFGSSISPLIHKILNIKFFNSTQIDFFKNVILQAIEYREKTNFYRPDMIHLLIQAKRNELKEKDDETIEEGFATVKESLKINNSKKEVQLTNDDILAQAMIFLFAGLDPIAVGIAFAAYELAMNADIQNRLLREIDDTLTSENGKITYETLMKMKYLDCVVSEVLRLRPIASLGERVSVKPYLIEPELKGEQPVYLPTNTKIWIPIYSIHQDPKNFPNPTKFDPDRFSDENKHNIKPFSYIPFGGGPRSCIASRFALMQIKIMIVKLVQHFELVPVAETPNQIRYSPGLLRMMPEEGLWLGMKRRSAN